MTGILGKTIRDYFNGFLSTLAENSGLLFWKGVGILLIIVGGKLVLNLISQLTARQIKKSEEMPEMQARRVQTMMTMTRSTFRYVVYGICALMILAQLGFGNAINNLLLSAGIGSLALGIGAQSLIKDVVTGFFMMFEKHRDGDGDARDLPEKFRRAADYHTQRHDRPGDQLFPDGFAGEGYGQHAV